MGTGCHHGRLQQGSLQLHAEISARLENCGPRLFKSLQILFDRMLSVQQDLWLDYWNEARRLADACIASQAVRRLGHGKRGVVPDSNSSTPLGETSACLIVINSALLQVIQAPAPTFTLLATDQRHEPGVDFDAGDDTVLFGEINHQFSVRGLLVQRLREQDRAAAVLAETLRAQQQLPPSLAVGLRVFNADGLQPDATGSVGLVHGQNSLAWRGQRLDGGQKLLFVICAVSPRIPTIDLTHNACCLGTLASARSRHCHGRHSQSSAKKASCGPHGGCLNNISRTRWKPLCGTLHAIQGGAPWRNYNKPSRCKQAECADSKA